MTGTDARPPLYLSASDAVNWTRFHPEDIGREIVVVEQAYTPLTPEQIAAPIRAAYGYNAAGEWVWADEAEGRWP